MKNLRNMAGLSLLLLLLTTGQALAACYHNGRLVRDGTRIGPLVCEFGRWVARP
ncbi:MAG TPA: hypothetical protein VIF14_04040 [Alphaproteobacteria bacterium]|jgi:hypothetical protein